MKSFFAIDQRFNKQSKPLEIMEEWKNRRINILLDLNIYL